jgi:hypothetical protein
VKTIDAIRTIHGFIDSPKFRNSGHVEVFYFTKLYGFTRWESWAPEERYKASENLSQQSETASARCSGPVVNTYRDQTFERIACREWTVIDIPAKPEQPPAWPVPGAT